MTLLVLSNSKDETANYLCHKLQDQPVTLLRIDTDTCNQELRITYTTDTPKLHRNGTTIHPDDIHAIWLRRPKSITIPPTNDPATDAHIANEWNDALEGFLTHIVPDRWMNHPTNNVRASHKLNQLTRAHALGLQIPDTLLTQSPSELAAFTAKHQGRIIVKPLASGFLERPDGNTTQIFTNRVQSHHDPSLLPRCPTLFQQEITKAYDVRLNAIDHHLTATALHPSPDTQDSPDIRQNNMAGVTYRPISIPSEIATRVRALLTIYDLRFAALDFAVTPAGEWIFFEINPNGQWAWLDIVGATELWRHFAEAFADA